ncbi:hypothetical protein QYM41_08010 [Kocuria sp. CPCC 205268]|uniref:hypothetical protein n=1 Tax=Kocuria oxytropis TaxID=3058913 RepID=UPI0034D632E9
MTDPRTPASSRVLPVLLGVLLLTGIAGAWWQDPGRPVPADEVVRADAWLRTEALLGSPSPGPEPAVRREDVRADLARQLEALGPAPDERTRDAARERRPAPGASAGDAGSTPPAALSSTAAVLAQDAMSAQDPALARVLAAAAVSRTTASRQPVPTGAAAPAGDALCEVPAEAPPGGAGAPAAVLWSALDRAGYAAEALAARTAGPAGDDVPAGLPDRVREDVEDLLELPTARHVLAAEPGLRAGAYVLPDGVREHPGRTAGTVAGDVQAAAAHVLARGDAGARCWAVLALERATGWRAELTGDVDALPGVVPGDPPG